MSARGKHLILLLSAAWLFATTAGLLLLANYDSQPGHTDSPPEQWPSGVSLARNLSKPTLVMFLHPRCPCSRASLYELARLAQGEPDTLDLQVVFAQPTEVTADWSQSDLWQQAVANRDFQVVLDWGGLLAKQFGARTSGQVLVFDRAGRLRFTGGITPGRGHTGDSFGRFLIKAIAAGQAAEVPARCAAFGCSLAANSPAKP